MATYNRQQAINHIDLGTIFHQEAVAHFIETVPVRQVYTQQFLDTWIESWNFDAEERNKENMIDEDEIEPPPNPNPPAPTNESNTIHGLGITFDPKMKFIDTHFPNLRTYL